MSKFEKGQRVIYKGRNGNERIGTVQATTGCLASPMIDLKLDNSSREHFYVPEDACTLIPDELGDIIN